MVSPLCVNVGKKVPFALEKESYRIFFVAWESLALSSVMVYRAGLLGRKDILHRRPGSSWEGRHRELDPLPCEVQCYYNLSDKWDGPYWGPLVREEEKASERNLPGAKGESLGSPSCPSQPGGEGRLWEKEWTQDCKSKSQRNISNWRQHRRNEVIFSQRTAWPVRNINLQDYHLTHCFTKPTFTINPVG